MSKLVTPKQRLNARIKWIKGNAEYIESAIDDIQNILSGRIESEYDINSLKGLLEKIDNEVYDFTNSLEEAVNIVNDELTIEPTPASLPLPGVGYPEYFNQK